MTIMNKQLLFCVVLFLVFCYVKAVVVNFENKFDQLKNVFSYGKSVHVGEISSTSAAVGWASIHYSTDLTCSRDEVYEVIGVVTNTCLPSSLTLDPTTYQKSSAYYTCKDGK
jgi:hypothetical protein